MSYIGSNPQDYASKVIGSGQCVAFVQACAGTPASSLWKAGVKVRGGNIAIGTAIATFNTEGVYENKSTGNHAAIYVSQDAKGITVWDQWKGQSVHKRVIRFTGGMGSPSNDGDAFSVIE